MNLIQNIFQNPEFFLKGDETKLKKRILKDIINMNWWNGCGLLIGYDGSQRVYADPQKWQLDAANSLFEFYWNYTVDRYTDPKALEEEIFNHMKYPKYRGVQTTVLPKFTIPFRADSGQCMIDKDGNQTFRDGTPTRPFYSLIYIAQNGFIDFDNKIRLKDWADVVESNPKYLKYFETCKEYFTDGENTVKQAIRNLSNTYEDFRKYLDNNLPILEDRKWLYDFCVNVEVKCDPYKNYETELLRKNGFVTMGGNEFIYFNDIDCVNCGKPHYRNGLCKDCCEINFKNRMIGNKLYGTTGTKSQGSNTVQRDSAMLAGAAASASSGSYRVSNNVSRQSHIIDDESVLQSSTNAISSRSSRAAGEAVGLATSGNSSTVSDNTLSDASSLSRASFASRAAGQNVGTSITGVSTATTGGKISDAGNVAVKSNASRAAGANISLNTTGVSTVCAGETISDITHTASASHSSRASGQNVGVSVSAASTAVSSNDIRSAANVSVSSGSSQSRGQNVGMQKTSASSSVVSDEAMQFISHDSRISAFTHTSGASQMISDETTQSAGLSARTAGFQAKVRAHEVEPKTVGTTATETSFARNDSTVGEAGKATRSSITTSPSAAIDGSSNFIGNIKDFVYTSPNTVRYYSTQGKVFDMTVPEGYKYPDSISTNRFFMFGSFSGNMDLFKQFCPPNAFVFDPFAGHGDRALFFMENGVKTYIGNDTNAKEWGFLNDNLIKLINKYKGFGQTCEVRIKNSMEFEPELENKVDFIYTSPPYFDFEVYDGFAEQIAGMKTYDDFHREFSVPIFKNVYRYMKDGGVVILQTEKDARLKQKWIDMMKSVGFTDITENDLSNQQKHGVNKTIQEICVLVKGEYRRTEVKNQTNTLF